MVASHAMCTVRALPSVPAFVESCAFCSVSVRDAASQRQPAPFCEVFASSRSGSVASAAQTDPAASTMIASTSSQQINFVRLKAHRPFLISAVSLPQMRQNYNKNRGVTFVTPRFSVCYSISSFLVSGSTLTFFGRVSFRTPVSYFALMPEVSMPVISNWRLYEP